MVFPARRTVFRARYAGVCDYCDRVIHVGDVVGYVGDRELVHDACVAAPPADPTVLQRGETICPHCQLAHAGECA